MGSDSREGDNASFGDANEIGGQRSDTTILVHLAADRNSGTVVHIPRDTLMTLPKCASETGQWEVTAKFNSAFTFGGPECTTQTVKKMTGLPIHHVVVVDFRGFENLVDAMGGVEICLEEPLYDPKAKLNLPAGNQTVQGPDALGIVRSRSTVGDGSDIARIQRQQDFLMAALEQATDRSLLANPVKMFRVMDAATSSLAVDDGLDDLSEMTAMANSVRNLRPENISFVTMPFVYAGDGSNVLINRDEAARVWSALKNDTPYPPLPKSPPKAQGPLTVAPQDISVQVLNGNGRDNQATQTAADLRYAGFTVTEIGMAGSTDYERNVIRFNPADAEAARTLKTSVGRAKMIEDPDLWAGQIVFVAGEQYETASPVRMPGKPSSANRDTSGGSVSTSICSG